MEVKVSWIVLAVCLIIVVVGVVWILMTFYCPSYYEEFWDECLMHWEVEKVYRDDYMDKGVFGQKRIVICKWVASDEFKDFCNTHKRTELECDNQTCVCTFTECCDFNFCCR